jgi:hypothetical protein
VAESKTKATGASVGTYFAAISDEVRRRDCTELAKLMARATKYPPQMWGASIVGFGSYHYKYDSGREGESCLVGFSPRKGDIAVYGLKAAAGADKLLSKLGRHKAGKGCVYIKSLSDVDLRVLEKLVASAAKERRGQHSQSGA